MDFDNEAINGDTGGIDTLRELTREENPGDKGADVDRVIEFGKGSGDFLGFSGDGPLADGNQRLEGSKIQNQDAFFALIEAISNLDDGGVLTPDRNGPTNSALALNLGDGRIVAPE